LIHFYKRGTAIDVEWSRTLTYTARHRGNNRCDVLSLVSAGW